MTDQPQGDHMAPSRRPNVTDINAHRSMPLAMEDCHAMQHQWRHNGVIGPSEQVDGFRRPFGADTGMIGYRSQCISCGSERVRWLSRSGEAFNRYGYADGYLSPPGESKPRSEWRESFAVRLFAGFDEPKTIRRGRRGGAS